MYANRCYKLISLYTPSEGQLFTVLHVNCEACPSSLCFVNWPRLPMCWHNEWYCMWDFFSFSQPNKMFDNLIVLCLIPVWRLYFRHTYIYYLSLKSKTWILLKYLLNLVLMCLVQCISFLGWKKAQQKYNHVIFFK